MAVLKKSKSGNQVQFLDEEGNMFALPTSSVLAFLRSTGKRWNCVVLKRLPFKVCMDRFPRSPLYDPKGESSVMDVGDTLKDDVLSKRTRTRVKEKAQYSDKKVW